VPSKLVVMGVYNSFPGGRGPHSWDPQIVEDFEFSGGNLFSPNGTFVFYKQTCI